VGADPRLSAMTKPKLTYFDNPRSRGEECRLALFVAGVDFEDNRLAREAWPALKPNTPFGSLPVFEVEGKPPVSQANAILGYVGRKYGLLPADEWEALRQDSLLSACEDVRHAVSATFGIKDPEELKRRRSALVEGPITAWARGMEQQIAGPFVGGATIGVADIKVFVVAGWFKSGVLDHVPADVLAKYPKLEQLFDSVKAHPKIVAWYARGRG
jgi:prostaglandin-H2 D-isomerase / glutathione transferase